ncbi:MAG TPA: TonB-dependent receptor [Candidatus Aquilonibacter sp.]|nr:TonB-dependent receptor [Candidatus Aquilonibacter sp.]
MSVAAAPAWGQSAGLAEISGTVRDQTGAVVPDAQVVISNASKGVHVELNTSDGGVFDAQALLPASGYAVTVDKSGFAHYDVTGINLQVGKNVGLEIALTLSGATAQVEVTATQEVDNTKTDVSQVIDSQQILDLPINGRRVDQFVLLTPGVTNDGNYGLLTFRGVANGNSFLLDGNDTTEQFYGENNGRTRIQSQISQDAVQEFQVVSANFSAEYGNAMGGVVNTVTRSGTNDYHGTGYWFYRNHDFNATDPFAGGINPDYWRLQSGASIGGPIIKDKLFFFVNGDFTRINSPIVDSISSSFITGEAFNNCAAPATTAQCSAIDGLLPRFFGQVPRTVDQDLAFGRIDYNLSPRNTLSFSFNYLHFKSPNGLQQTLVSSTSGAGVNSNGNDFARVRNGKGTWTSILSPNLVNIVRYGWDTDLQGDGLNPALNGTLGLLDLSVSSVTLGAVNYLPRVEPNEIRNEVGDDLAWTRGRHVFKFGVDFATTNDYSFFIQNANGSYTYSGSTGATLFAQDFTGNTTNAKNWTTFSQAFGNPAVTTRINYYGLYAEDQWKATDKLTINFGGRYEYSQIPQPTVCNPAAPLTCHINSPNTNLMPRIGLAYQLNNKTVIRAGYGLFYARVMGATLQDLFTGNGVTTQTISLSSSNSTQKACGPVFPAVFTSLPACAAAASGLNIQFAAPNFTVPYTEQAILAVERELAHNLTLTVSGIWSRGVHLYSVFDTNLPPASNTTTETYTILNTAQTMAGLGTPVGTYTTPVLLGVGGVKGARPNTNFGGMYEDGNGVVSFYDGLTVQLQKRFSHGFQADASYTWSHEIDDGQGYGQESQNIFLSSASAWLVNGNYRLDYGDGLEDQPQRFVLSWIWTPTFTHRDGAFYKYLVNNWELSSITTINSSRPYGNPTVFTNGTPVTGMFSVNSLNGYGLSSRVPFLPESDAWQPAAYRDDMRLSKILPFGERYKLYLSLEVFNISNSWSPTSLHTQLYNQYSSTGTTVTTCPSAAVTPCIVPLVNNNYDTGSGDALNPDGTEARRLQVSARFTF